MVKQRRILKVIIALALCCLLGMLGWLWYDNTVDRSGWREKNGITYYADFHGRPVSGWQEIEGKRYYFGDDTAPVTLWQEIDGQRRYFHPDGTLAQGWQDIDGSRYYLSVEGIPARGWLELDGNRFFMDADGAMQTGWLILSSGTYYLNEAGTPVTGWMELEEQSYYFAGDGIMATGWTELEDGLHYFRENGAAAEGWTELEENRYYFAPQGIALTGWQEIETVRYYFTPEGTTLTGWQDLGENRYYFNEDGSLYTGWLQQGEYSYYLNEDGTMAVSPTVIGDRTYYFTPAGIHVLLVNPWNPLPDDYQVDLVGLNRGFKVDRSILDALNAMFEACRAAGYDPVISSAYRTEADQQRIWNNYVAGYVAQGYTNAQAQAMTRERVAVPGTSEHHMGLALDIVGWDYYGVGGYGSTQAVQKWLHEHCWEYGFIYRYQDGKQHLTGYIPETWHFRYVGVEVAMAMKDTGLCLEEYLGAVQE